MIEEHALIVSVANTPPHLAMLEVERAQACGLCGQTRGCGNRAWGNLFQHQQGQFPAINRIQAKVGDVVVVAIDERSVMWAALLLYLLPIITMLVLAAIAQASSDSEWAGLFGAVLGLAAGLLWVKGWLMARPHGFSQPEIVRLASDHTVNIQSAHE